MKTPNTHIQTAFRLLVASILAATLLAVTPTATAEEPKKATTRTEENVKDDIQQRQDSEQRITKEKHKPSTNNVRAQSAKAKAIKTHIQTLHQQISDIYRKRHDVIYDKTKPQNERNQESKKLLDQAKALQEKLNKAAEQYQQILSSTSILN